MNTTLQTELKALFPMTDKANTLLNQFNDGYISQTDLVNQLVKIIYLNEIAKNQN